DDDPVPDGRMAFLAGVRLVDAHATEGDPLIELHVVAQDAGLADDHAGTVVDAEPAADDGTGMYVDAGKPVCRHRDQPRQQPGAVPVQYVRDAVARRGDETGIGPDHLVEVVGGRVAVDGGSSVLQERVANGWQTGEQGRRHASSLRSRLTRV